MGSPDKTIIMKMIIHFWITKKIINNKIYFSYIFDVIKGAVIYKLVLAGRGQIVYLDEVFVLKPIMVSDEPWWSLLKNISVATLLPILIAIGGSNRKFWKRNTASSNSIKRLSIGAIHKRRHQFFGIFDPPPPSSSLLLNKFIK